MRCSVIRDWRMMRGIMACITREGSVSWRYHPEAVAPKSKKALSVLVAQDLVDTGVIEKLCPHLLPSSSMQVADDSG